MTYRFDMGGRITQLTIGQRVLPVLFGGHEYAVSRQRPPLNHFTNGYRRVESSLEYGSTVFKGVLRNPQQLQGKCRFVTRYTVEKEALRLETKRTWFGEASVYDDSLFFITRPLNFFSPKCNQCRKPREKGFWWQLHKCKECSNFVAWWRQFKVWSPHNLYYKHYGTKPRLYKIEETNQFHSQEAVVKTYSRQKSYKEFQVFTDGVKGAYAEIVGHRFGIRLEILETSCTQAQLRIVMARYHQYSEIEFQFANHGRRKKGMVHTLDCRIRPMKY